MSTSWSMSVLGGGIYGVWLIAPLVVGWLLIQRRVKFWIFIPSAMILVLIALPAYLFLPAFAFGWIWPPDYFLPQTTPTTTIANAHYRAYLTQAAGGDFYDTYLTIQRLEDQAIRSITIDDEAGKCWTITLMHDGSRSYFLCNAETISAQRSYVDLEQGSIYEGQTGTVYRLQDLFSEP